MNLVPRQIKRFGWRPDLPDANDRYLAFRKPVLKLPDKIDYRPNCPPVLDQGELGSCTANAIAGAIGFDALKQGFPLITPSRLFIYYYERYIEHTVRDDSGAMLRDGIKVVRDNGAPDESLWPYDISKFTVKPSQKAISHGKQHQVLGSLRVRQSLLLMKQTLVQGFPFVFGFAVYESFASKKVERTGIVPMPKDNESQIGGHAVLCIGYDDEDEVFIVRNSYGPKWGMKGYFTIPYEYLTNRDLADDFWCITLVEVNGQTHPTAVALPSSLAC